MAVSRFFQRYLKWQIYVPKDFRTISGFHIDLGSGNHIRNPLNFPNVFGSDYKLPSKQDKNPNFYVFDLTGDFPFENGSVASFTAFDVIEHIPRWERGAANGMLFPFLGFMNQINRCLVTGGIFLAVTPAVPSPAAFQDPTHVNFITEETINYFANFDSAKNLDYEYSGSFKIVHQSWVYTQYVFTSFKQQPSSNILYYSSLLLNLLKICVNIFIRKNRPTHLLWILQKV